jgi:hypothetical protein
MNNIQLIYNTLRTQQQELIKLSTSHPQRSVPQFQIELLSAQIAQLSNAVILTLKELGAQMHG